MNHGPVTPKVLAARKFNPKTDASVDYLRHGRRLREVDVMNSPQGVNKMVVQTFLWDFVRSLGTLRQGSDARFAQGQIRHNSLRSACGTYSGSPLHCALHLKDSHYDVHEARTM